VVEAAPPAVGPEPASREASNFVTFSISAVHCPAWADATGKATKIQVPNINGIVLMALPLAVIAKTPHLFGVCGVTISTDEATRCSVRPKLTQGYADTHEAAMAGVPCSAP
jgi:hypothetical protein